ncbi:flagellar hook assembly protein FlgD [Nocardioides sp.]|uniref:flagellar hook assembly protein FlgD n=1 Tax=Nocardioides sp. TaxID=35761 RepID=UPI002B27227B|nr:flagellar hook capping FlgD N-terminal domain-containing protein [Nocardioides sp.]
MSVSAVETAANGGLQSLVSSTTTAASADKEMFLQLLVAQLRYQDPMNPADTGEFLSQSAQFTSLEKMQDVADQTALVLGAQIAFGASGLVGRDVSYTLADGTTGQGPVDSVTFGAEGPVLEVDGIAVPIGQVHTVTSAGSTSSPDPS